MKPKTKREAHAVIAQVRSNAMRADISAVCDRNMDAAREGMLARVELARLRALLPILPE